MLELHRYKHVDWKPSPIVALAASVDGGAIAVGRRNGSIEIWIVSAGSVGWHCELTISGKEESSISCLLWCPSRCSKRGRLFSAGLDGLITEWDLYNLQTKEVVNSFGGSVWQMALQPSCMSTEVELESGSHSLEQTSFISTDHNSDSDEDRENPGNASLEQELKVAVGCDDGRVRLFSSDDGKSLIYMKAFSRVQGRILSVAWSTDAARVFSGGSDGCIRCWDVSQLREVYRITAALGGASSGSTLCIWSIMTLRNGTIVSGDSSGSTQFWDENQGTLLQCLTAHKADVLALAASPSHQSIFAAGADGQVVQFQLVSESSVLADTVKKDDSTVGVSLGARWVFVGSKRTHTHDVNALVVAAAPVADQPMEVGSRIKVRIKRKRQKRSWLEQDRARTGASGAIAMLLSGGNDAKLFTYPANAFLAFHPHDICSAPQPTPIKLSLGSKLQNGLLMMAQHEHEVELWKIKINISGTTNQAPLSTSAIVDKDSNFHFGKRNQRESREQDNRKRMANGHLKQGKPRAGILSNGPRLESSVLSSPRHNSKTKGSAPELLGRIMLCKSAGNISCSAISNTGQFVAISDQAQLRLYEVEQCCTGGTTGSKSVGIKRKRLPHEVPPAHCMVFCGTNRLIIAAQANALWVVDVLSASVLHQFVVERDSLQQDDVEYSPVTSMCTSSDEQYVVTVNGRGSINVFNLQIYRLHWNVPPLDGNYVTAACFHPRKSDILVVTTSTNIIYVLDVDSRKLGEWSENNSLRLPRSFLEFPGGIHGLSISPSKKRTIAIAYSSNAMYLIDFQKTVPQDEGHLSKVTTDTSKQLPLQNGGKSASERNFVLVPFKDPVLFAGYIGKNSVLVLEKPWVEAISRLTPPVYRHLYGT